MTDDITTAHMTRDEAVAFVKKHRRGRQCYVRGGTFLRTRVDDSGNERGYEGTCLIRVGAKVAIRYVFDMLSDPFVEKGCRIRIAVSNGCLFVG